MDTTLVLNCFLVKTSLYIYIIFLELAICGEFCLGLLIYTVLTSKGHWEFSALPFGLSNASATFLCLMDLALALSGLNTDSNVIKSNKGRF